VRPEDDRRDAAAEDLGVAGYLAARHERYHVERGTWAWWQAEVTWMRKPGKRRRKRRSPTGTTLFDQTDRPDYPQYPRGPRGSFDHVTAARLIRDGILQPARELLAA
jgi:hypothetical protein